ncbi:MAG: hypothetical protein KH757_01960, partial [Megasphaera sp.]|nr:hypothetical protein [Megasphaera sp.]
ENDLHSRVKLGINKSKDLFTGVHSIIVQFSKVIVPPQRRLVYLTKLRGACQHKTEILTDLFIKRCPLQIEGDI